ncbi:MAG TPA: Eco29kI family restriction endonuclease [Isosphaeraceae bacterium]|nr:Eco29kI family restriction endonuclease [Isosphaeraceae bacterium]
MLDREVFPLPPEEFLGAGLYAIYYTGRFPAYRRIAARNRDGRFEEPIYVGKAVPAGARRGGFGLGASAGNVLYRRLAEHAESIRQARNLKLEDFRCRYLVVDDIWIPLAESLLIQTFQPIWNLVIDGFGNHDPGSGRYNQKKARWDVIHPGRLWAEKLAKGNPKSESEILEIVAEFLRGSPTDVLETPEE